MENPLNVILLIILIGMIIFAYYNLYLDSRKERKKSP